jgi:predicted transposase YbfD/YdcC
MEAISPISRKRNMATSPRLSQSSIRKFFAALPDPRRRRTRVKHPLLTLIVVALCATIAGADTWEAVAAFARLRHDWLARFVDLSNGIPSHDTFGRVFAALDPVAFQKCLVAWVQRLHEVTQGQVIAIDGKVAREAMARAGDQGPMTLVSAWATANHVFLGQVAGPKGSNELGALPKLLELLDLHGAIVTLDALGCQKEIVRQIVEQGGDYVISVKGNQESLQAAVHAAFDAQLQGLQDAAPDSSKAMKTHLTHDATHGRNDHRVVAVMELPEDFAEREQWPGLKSLVMVTRDGENSQGKSYTGVRYFISSLPAKVKQLAQAVRSHWSIENEMHWVLDVAFREDRNRARAEHEQANLGVLRRTALSLLKNADGLTGSVHCRRQQAGWDEKTLELVLFGWKASED